MEIRIPLPLDGTFLRRQCPNCDREFKWHHGPTDDRPPDAVDPIFYYCPYCGEPANSDMWWTHDQVGFMQATAVGPAMEVIEQELGSLGNRHTGGLISFDIKTTSTTPPLPEPLVEPDDMIQATSPCHPWEPVKITEDWAEGLFCLVCGERFGLA